MSGTVSPMANVEFKTEGSGAVDELVVVERVDREGDGYASGFQLKVVSDTRPKDPYRSVDRHRRRREHCCS
jgi:hypothetical protein